MTVLHPKPTLFPDEMAVALDLSLDLDDAIAISPRQTTSVNSTPASRLTSTTHTIWWLSWSAEGCWSGCPGRRRPGRTRNSF
jgi:hypothetical protein